MDTLDARQFVVRGCRWAGNERHWPEHPTDPWTDLGHRLGNRSDDLPLLDEAEVVVGNEGQRTRALAGPAVQNDRPCLGDCEGTSGQSAVHPVERECVEGFCHDLLLPRTPDP